VLSPSSDSCLLHFFDHADPFFNVVDILGRPRFLTPLTLLSNINTALLPLLPLSTCHAYAIFILAMLLSKCGSVAAIRL